MDNKAKILVLCTGNSCRSQMAEGILKHLAGDIFDVHSAGSNPTGTVHPYAISVMSDIGIDISLNRSKPLVDFVQTQIDTLVTVCGSAARDCCTNPFSQALHYHWEFEDPADAQGSEEKVLNTFKCIRDQIRLVASAYVGGYREAKNVQDRPESLIEYAEPLLLKS